MLVRFSNPIYPNYGKITKVKLIDELETSPKNSHYIYKQIESPGLWLSRDPYSIYYAIPIKERELEWE